MSLHTLIFVSGSVYGCAVYIRKSEDLSGYDRFPPLDAEYWLLVGRRSERSTTDLWRAQRLQLLDQPTTRWSQSSPSAVAFLCQLLFNKWNEVFASLFCKAGEASLISRVYGRQTERVFDAVYATIWSWQIWRAFCKGLDPTRNRWEAQLPGSRRMPSQSADSYSCQWGSKVSINTSDIEVVPFWRYSTHRSWWRADYSDGTTGSQEDTRAEHARKGIIALHRKLGKGRKNASMGTALGNRIFRRCQIRTGFRVKREIRLITDVAKQRSGTLCSPWSWSRGIGRRGASVQRWHSVNSDLKLLQLAVRNSGKRRAIGYMWLYNVYYHLSILQVHWTHWHFLDTGLSHIVCSYFLAILHVVLRVENSLRSSILGQEASCRDLLASWANMSLV